MKFKANLCAKHLGYSLKYVDLEREKKTFAASVRSPKPGRFFKQKFCMEKKLPTSKLPRKQFEKLIISIII